MCRRQFIVLLTFCFYSLAHVHLGLAAAKIYCEQPEFNFGEQFAGTSVNASFEIRNDGDEPLTIREVKADCACTFAKADTDRIPPGGRTELRATLSLKSRKGDLQRHITVKTNDPSTPEFVLGLVGKAIVPIDVTPAMLMFGAIDANDAPERTVDLTATNPNKSFRVLKYECGDPHSMMARLEQIDADHHFRFHVQLTKPLTPGAFRSYLLVWTDDPQMKVLVIAVSASVTGELIVEPNRIALFADTAGHPPAPPVSKTVIVRASSDKTFKILGVKTPDSSISCSVTELDEATYEIKIDGLQPQPKLKGQAFLVETNVQSLGTIRIPIQFRTEAVDEPPSPASLLASTQPSVESLVPNSIVSHPGGR